MSGLERIEMNPVVKFSGKSLFIAAFAAAPLSAFGAPLITVHTVGDSLVLGSTPENREYTRDYYGYDVDSVNGISAGGDVSDPNDPRYHPAPFVGWRGEFNRQLAENGFQVDMVGNVSAVTNLPDTKLDGSLNPAQFTTTDGRTYTYDSDNDAHGGWRIGGTYNLANVNGRTNLRDANGGATSGNGSWVHTAGQIPFSTFDSGPIDIVSGGGPTGRDGADVIDTDGLGLSSDSANVFDRGIADHVNEIFRPGNEADVIFLQIGINDVKNREDVENSAYSSAYDRVYNGNGQARLHDLILAIRAEVGDDVEIYLSNIPTVNRGFDYGSDAQGRLDAQAAIEGFNDGFFDTYGFGDWDDIAGYTDAIATSSNVDLANVFLVNTHGQIDELIGVGTGSEDYANALSEDELHWTEPALDQMGVFYADLIAANTAVPEPTTAGLFVVGAGLFLSRRRRPA